MPMTETSPGTRIARLLDAHHGADGEAVAGGEHGGEVEPARLRYAPRSLAAASSGSQSSTSTTRSSSTEPSLQQRVLPAFEAPLDRAPAAPHQEQDPLVTEPDQMIGREPRARAVAGRDAGKPHGRIVAVEQHDRLGESRASAASMSSSSSVRKRQPATGDRLAPPPERAISSAGSAIGRVTISSPSARARSFRPSST